MCVPLFISEYFIVFNKSTNNNEFYCLAEMIDDLKNKEILKSFVEYEKAKKEFEEMESDFKIKSKEYYDSNYFFKLLDNS